MEQSSQYLPEITNRVLGQAWLIHGEVPQPGLDSEVRQKGWMVHLKGVIRHGTEWGSQGFSRKKGSFDSSPPSPSFTEPTCTLPTAFPISIAHGESLPFPFLHKCFQDVQKMLAPGRVCPHKRGCMHAHISEIHLLLCRGVSNTEPFKMLIFVCFYNIFIPCSLNEGFQAFFIPLQLPSGH